MPNATSFDQPAPPIFQSAVTAMRAWQQSSHISVVELPAPQGIAPFTFALSAEIDQPGQLYTEGWLTLLHDPVGHHSWDGTLRLVSHVIVDLDHSHTIDQPRPTTMWTWLINALRQQDAPYRAAAGTATFTSEVKLGALAKSTTADDVSQGDDPHDGRDHETFAELRASWTPAANSLGAHAKAWSKLLTNAAANSQAIA